MANLAERFESEAVFREQFESAGFCAKTSEWCNVSTNVFTGHNGVEIFDTLKNLLELFHN